MSAAAGLFGRAFRETEEDARKIIQDEVRNLEALDAIERENKITGAIVSLQVNMELEFRKIMYSMLEVVASFGDTSAREKDFLSRIHSEWEIQEEAESSEAQVMESNPDPEPTMEVFQKLLATAVSCAYLRVLAVRKKGIVGDSDRQKIEESFWIVLETIFNLAVVGPEGKPNNLDAPSICAAFGSAYKVREAQSDSPEVGSFLQLRCDYLVLFPNKPLPYEPSDGTEDFEDHLNRVLEKRKAELSPGWREKMLSPIVRGEIKSTPSSGQGVKSTPSASSGCAIFLLSGIGILTSYLV